MSGKIHYKRGEYICRQYDDSKNMLILVEKGFVRMTFTGANGKDHINFFGGSGYVFGWRSIIDNQSYRGSLVAHSRCTVYKIPKEIVIQALQKDEKFWQFAFMAEYERGKAYSRKCEMLTLNSSKQKLISVILSLYNRIGDKKAAEKRIPISLTHDLLAQIIYSDRVTVSRIISGLKKQGYIEYSGKEITILQYDKLYNMLYDE